MAYEINVSKGGSHLFATAERSVVSKNELRKVYPVILEKFPKEEGYAVTVTYWSTSGGNLDMETYLD